MTYTLWLFLLGVAVIVLAAIARTHAQRALLGWPSRSAFYNWRSGSATLPYDTLVMAVGAVPLVGEGLQIHVLEKRGAALQVGQILDIEHGCDDNRGGIAQSFRTGMVSTYEADGAEIQQIAEGLFCIPHGLEDAEELRFVIV